MIVDRSHSLLRSAGMASSIGNQILVGIEEIDNDHARIIELIRKFESIVNTKADTPDVMDVISNIIGAFETHFENEARIMNSAKYQFRDEHIFIHGVLFEKLTLFIYLLETGDAGVDKILLEFLHSWMFHHVVEHDKKFAQSQLGF